MTAVYPAALITANELPLRTNNVDPVVAEDVNPVYEELIAIESSVGALPAIWDAATTFTTGTTFTSLSKRVGNLERGFLSRVVDTIGGTTIQPTSSNSTAIPLVIKQYSSSTANLLEFKNSSGTVTNSISKDGALLTVDGGTA